MARNFKVGSFTTAASGTADIPLTGFGFAPSATKSVILFWGGPTTADQTIATGANSSGSVGVGMAISTTVHGCAAVGNRDSADGGTAVRYIARDNRAYTSITRSMSAEGGSFHVKSYDGDGVTLQVDVAFAAAVKIFYLCITATDFDNLAIASKAISESGGANGSVTGLSFQPTWCITLACSEIFTTLNTILTTNGGGIMLGATDGTRQVASAIAIGSGTSCRSMVRSDRFICFPRYDSATERLNASFVSFNSDGLTYTVNRSSGTPAPVVLFLMGNGACPFYAGSYSSQTATGVFNGPTVGFPPGGCLVWGTGQATASQTTGSADGNLSVGGATSASARGSSLIISPTAAQDTAARSDTTKVVQNYNRTGADTFALVSDQDLAAFGPSITTFDQITAEPSTQKLWLFLAFGAVRGGGRGVAKGLTRGLKRAIA